MYLLYHKKSGSEIREIIVDTAKAICQQHTDKLATYDQTYRTVNFRNLENILEHSMD